MVEAITEQLQAARASGAAADEAAGRTLLDRLGEPAEIVATALASLAPLLPTVALIGFLIVGIGQR